MAEQWTEERRKAHSEAMKSAHAAKKSAPKKAAKKPVKRRKKKAQAIPLHAIPAKPKAVKKVKKMVMIPAKNRNDHTDTALMLLKAALKLLEG